MSFIKYHSWTEAIPNLTVEEEKLINILLDLWVLNNNKEFTYRNSELSKKLRFKHSYAKRGLVKAKQTLKELGLITYRKSGNDGCCYTINQEIVDKLSNESCNSTNQKSENKEKAESPLTVEKPKVISTVDEFNECLITQFEKIRDSLLSTKDRVSQEARRKLRSSLATQEAIRMFGSLSDFNHNFHNQFIQWSQKQKDLKSQTP